MARVIAAVPVVLAVRPMLVTRRHVAILIDGHADGAVVALGIQDPGREILQLLSVALRFFLSRGNVDAFGHGRVEVLMGMAVFLHLFPPSLDHLWGLSQDIRGTASDDLNLVLGREVDAGG